MTNQERAEKIVYLIELTNNRPDERREALASIRAILDEAVREAVEAWCLQPRDFKTADYAHGFASAREQAAGISQSHECSIAHGAETCNCDIEIAERIRNMKCSPDSENPIRAMSLEEKS